MHPDTDMPSPEPTEADRLVGRQEAAQILDVHVSTLGRWVKRGLVKPAYVLPTGVFRFRVGDLEAVRRGEGPVQGQRQRDGTIVYSPN